MKKVAMVIAILFVVQLGLYAQAGRVAVKLPKSVADAYTKGTDIKITQPNIMAVRGAGVQDMSCAKLRDLEYGKQKTLVVKIVSLEGKFRWDAGKMFGIRINNIDLVPTGARTYVVMDKFINGPHEAGEELKFNLADAGALESKITIDVLLYCGGTKYTLEFWYE